MGTLYSYFVVGVVGDFDDVGDEGRIGKCGWVISGDVGSRKTSTVRNFDLSRQVSQNSASMKTTTRHTL